MKEWRNIVGIFMLLLTNSEVGYEATMNTTVNQKYAMQI